MAKVNFKVKGSKELRSALSDMSTEVQAEVGKAVLGSAIALREDVIKSISKKGTGTVYYRIYDAESGTTSIFAGDSEGYVGTFKGGKNLSQTHQASAAGKAPAKDTGRLEGSIYFDKVGDLSAIVGSNVVYALHLEYGTLTMAARPFFRPAVERMKPKFQRRLELAIERATT